MVTIVTCFLSAKACSTSCVKEATKSMADRLGRAPPCWSLSTWWVRAVQASLCETTLSKPLEIHESRAIGRQDLTKDLSFFPAFGIIATLALFQVSGK
jgi:hypothetical protein